MQKKRSYDVAFKLKVVEEAEKFGNRAAGRKHSVDECRVREWRQKKSDLEKLPSKKKRMRGGREEAWFTRDGRRVGRRVVDIDAAAGRA